MAADIINVHKRLSFVMKNCTEESLEKCKKNVTKDSPVFEIVVDDNITKWVMTISPMVINYSGETDKYIGFHLILQDSSSPNFKAIYEFGILGKTANENYSKDEKEATGCELTFGYNDFISHDQLFDEYKRLIINGNLTFFVDLTLIPIVSEGPDKKVIMYQALVADYKKMFDNEFLADFTLIAKDGKERKVHKTIIVARSPMVYAMLQHNMKEATESVANVPDFDSIVLKELMRFIYYNEVENLPSVVHELVYAAEKYQVDQLKDLCLDEIISSLTTENVFKSLIIAERVSETKNLFSECLNLIAINFESLEEWKNLPLDIILKIVRHRFHLNLQKQL